VADRILHTDPPTPEYRQVGWHCIYHEQAGRSCHNPMDCDLVPMWALTVDDAKRLLADVPFGSGRGHR
jgi:hypothetical protein